MIKYKAVQSISIALDEDKSFQINEGDELVFNPITGDLLHQGKLYDNMHKFKGAVSAEWVERLGGTYER